MVLAVIVLGYLLGSLPFGLILGWLVYRIDVRQHGSGNIGATNVLRLIGWKAALPVFLLDLAKGAAAVMIARYFFDAPLVYMAAGLAAMLGHSFSIFIGFKGGKAAATGVGVLGALSPWITLILLACFAIIIGLTRYVSLGSITCAALAPILFALFGFSFEYLVFALIMAILVIWRHHENVGRLLKGTESRLGQKKSGSRRES